MSSPDQPWFARRRFIGSEGTSWALFLLALLPVAVILRLIAEYGVNVPYGDEWSLLPLFAKWHDHQLTFADLFRQHNEHRIFFPKLIYLAFAQWTHWNVRSEMFFSVLLCCGTSACLYVLLKRTVPGRAQKHLLLWALINLLIFAPVQAENWLWGFQLQVFIPTLCLVATLVILNSRLRGGAKLIAIFLLAVVGTFSFGGGLLLWPVIAFYLVLQQENKRWLIIWSIMFVLVATFYFIGYDRKPLLAPQSGNPGDYVVYFATFNGGVLGRAIPHSLVLAPVIGASALLFYLAACCLALKSPSDVRRASGPWLTLGAYAICSAALAAYARVSGGPQQSLDSRYTSISVNLYIALVGITAIASHYIRQLKLTSRLSQAVTSVETAFFTAIVMLYGAGSWAVIHPTVVLNRRELQGLASLEFCKVIAPPDRLRNDLMIRAEFSTIMQDVDLLDRLQLLHPPIRHSAILVDGQDRPLRSTTEFGRCEQLVQKNSDTFEISGWSFLPEEERPAPCVALAYQSDGNWLAFALSDVRQTRPDIVQEMKSRKYIASGWRKIIHRNELPEGAARISAWALDPVAGEVYKLPGDFPIPAR